MAKKTIKTSNRQKRLARSSLNKLELISVKITEVESGS